MEESQNVACQGQRMTLVVNQMLLNIHSLQMIQRQLSVASLDKQPLIRYCQELSKKDVALMEEKLSLLQMAMLESMVYLFVVQ